MLYLLIFAIAAFYRCWRGMWREGFAVFILNIQNQYPISKYMGTGELFAFDALGFTSGSISQNLLKCFF